MEMIISASICLYEVDGKFFMQVISGENQNHFIVPISKDEAFHIQGIEGLNVDEYERHPKGVMIIGKKK